jgi:hypothetical protein
VTVAEANGKQILDIALEKVECKVTIDDLGNALV